MKIPSSLLELNDRSVEVLDFETVVLAPIGELHTRIPEVVRFLLKLRSANPDVFPDSSTVTLESTEVWLRDHLVGNPDRLLFIIQDLAGVWRGHMGLYLRDGNRLELDNIVVSPDTRVPGLMTSALKSLASWAAENFNLDRLYLQTLSSNTDAQGWYRRLGLEDGTAANRDSDWSLLADSILLTWPAERFLKPKARILTAGPSISSVERAMVGDAVRNGWNDASADFLNVFEREFAHFVGCQHSLATDSCTSALHLALWAAGVGPGDEVIVPETTWVATATAVRYVGAIPVFADVDPMTWCIDPSSAAEKVNGKTKAIMPVHLYGVVADLGALERLALDNNLLLIQDAAPAIGALYQGKRIGSFGDAACFSFQGAKLLVSGEGGSLATNSEALVARAQRLRTYGRVPSTFWLEEFGRKMQMGNLTAALALAQLSSARRQIAQKVQINHWYRERLTDVPVVFQEDAPGNRGISWMTSFVMTDCGEQDRDSLIRHLREEEIDSRPVFPAISQYPMWETVEEPGPIALRIGQTGINLPSGVRLGERDVDRICETVRSWFSAN
jgi:perosamine synthetase